MSRRVSGLVAIGCALSAFASAPAAAAEPAANPPAARAKPSRADPWEPVNRKVYAFNEAVDTALLRPLAEAYEAVVPRFVRGGVDNFFGNFNDAWSVVNHLLQGKAAPAVEMTVRVTTNSVLGLGGLLDIASEMGLERQSEDLGQTLGRWGLPSGPYVVLPLLGASSVRDAAGRVVDRRASAANVVAQDDRSWLLTTVDLVSTRAGLLPATRLLEAVALDKYTFVRDAYLARRRSEVHDGNPPEEPEDLPASGPASDATR